MNLVKHKVEAPVKRVIRKYQPTYPESFRGIFDLMNDYSSLFDYVPRLGHNSMPLINMRDEGNQYVVEVDVPGYTAEDLSISIDGNQLTISGNYAHEADEQTDKYLIRERQSSKFVRTVSLPKEANAEYMGASLQKGVLILDIPKRVGAETPKTIKIVTKE